MDAVESKKLPYEAPVLLVHGTFERITQGLGEGSHLDATFSTGTPFNQLTFS